MGLTDYIPGIGDEDELSEENLSRAPVDESVESKLEQQEEELQQLREELQEKEKEENARTARLEERAQEKQQEVKELREQLQEQQEKIQDLREQESRATTATPPPETKQLEGSPVISAGGYRVFGEFKGWINRGDKVGIEVAHPNHNNKREKIGWAESIKELVIDAQNFSEKDALIVKVNYRGEKVDYVNIHRHREVLQRKEELEDERDRLSSEKDELVKQNRRLEKLNQKLLTQQSINMLDGEMFGSDGNDELIINEMAKEQQLNKQRIDTLSEQHAHKRNQTSELIEQYEDQMNGELGGLTTPNSEQAIEETGKLLQDLLRNVGVALDELDQETKEDLLAALGSGGGGGSINISDE